MMPEFEFAPEPESQSESEPVDQKETLYPASPKAAPYESVPPPLPGDMQKILDEINRKEVGAR